MPTLLLLPVRNSVPRSRSVCEESDAGARVEGRLRTFPQAIQLATGQLTAKDQDFLKHPTSGSLE